jgi:hypothetical protein
MTGRFWTQHSDFERCHQFESLADKRYAKVVASTGSERFPFGRIEVHVFKAIN